MFIELRPARPKRSGGAGLPIEQPCALPDLKNFYATWSINIGRSAARTRFARKFKLPLKRVATIQIAFHHLS
jgi:hypothetical protein